MALESTKPNPERDSAEMERRHNCNNAIELARSKLESDIVDFAKRHHRSWFLTTARIRLCRKNA
jgi:hypothetical protein